MNNIENLLKQLTIEEKAALLEGYQFWKTNPVPRLRIPSVYMTDGPHGLRKVKDGKGDVGISENEPATCFPTAATAACSWNPSNAYRMGAAIAKECSCHDVDILLGPGVNIKRSPLCGRNFEYYSEDPFVSGVFGAEFVKGLQDNGIGCSVKHYAANSNEDFRYNGDSLVDERALREIYLKAFEMIVKNAKPRTVMCSYNKVNGTYSSENSWLLNDVLRKEWGYEGLVMTDWGAATPDRAKGVKAGCDLDMPGGVSHNRASISEGVKSGKLSMEELDRAVSRVLEIVSEKSKKKMEADMDKNARLASEIAIDSAVLLKNDGILPLDGDQKLLVVGEMFEKMRYQGAGSSLVNPYELVTPEDAFDVRGIDYSYEKGYEITGSAEGLADSAVDAAAKADVILFFGGLTDYEESEGFDRQHMRLDDEQLELMDRLAQTGKKVVVVLFAGAPVELPFHDDVSAILDMYLPGMYGGEAAAALLFGEASPSGRLAESWPMKVEDSSCFDDYGKSKISKYYESIYVGYRFYDKKGTLLRFPFGYGLSYTDFECVDTRISKEGGNIRVEADVENIGAMDASEVVQVYAGIGGSKVFRPVKELVGFKKIHIKAGETKRAAIEFTEDDLAFWHAGENRFVVENGKYTIYIGANTEKIWAEKEIAVEGHPVFEPPYGERVMRDYEIPPSMVPESFEELLGYEIPEEGGQVSVDSSLNEIRDMFLGGVVYKAVNAFMGRDYKKALKMPDSPERDAMLKNAYFLKKVIPTNTFRSMAMASGGLLSYKMAKALAMFSGGRIFKAMGALFTREAKVRLPVEKK